MSRTPLSKSRLEKARCLFKFNRLVLEKFPVPASEPMLFGRFFHLIAERYVRAVAIDAKKPTPDLALAEAIFKKEWAERADGEAAGLSDDHYEAMRELCLAWAQGYKPDPGLMGVEVRYAVDVDWQACGWNDDRVFFRAVIDRLEVEQRADGTARVRVVDYKTSWNALSEAEILRGPDARAYSAIVSAIVPGADLEVVLEFPRSGASRLVEMPAGAAEAARERIMEESDRIEKAKRARKWPATPSSECRYCPLLNVCPAKAAAHEFASPKPEDAAALLGEWAIADARRTRAAEALKLLVAEYGPQRGNGMKAEHTPKQEPQYDTETLAAALAAHGYDPYKYLRVDRRSLDAECRKSRPLEADVKAMTKWRGKTVWTIGPDDEGENE